jgi:tetratricopeptide (TPR) repeat protein
MACICSLILGLMFIAPFSAHGQSSNPQQVLNQYVADLQKNPGDYALREKIIRHVQTMRPAPAVPREAERFMNRGAAAAKSAKDANDFKDVAAEFEKATLSAPWMANAYYNLGVAQDKAGMHSSAIRSLKLYLLAAPNAPDAKSVEKLIDEIEYRQEKAAKESSPQAVAARKQNEYEQWLKKIDGRRYTYKGPPMMAGTMSVLEVTGKVLATGVIVEPNSPVQGRRGYTEHHRYEIRGHMAEGPVLNYPDTPFKSYQEVCIISENGDRITKQIRLGNGRTEEQIHLWQR